MTGIKRFTGVAVMALIFAACGGSDTTASTDVTSVAPTTTVPPTTTTTVPPTTTTTLSEEELAAIQYDEDVKAIKTLWRRYSDSWFGGVEAGYAYLEENNYYAVECTAEEFSRRDVVEGFQEEIVVDEATIERDDGWAITGGVAHGIVPDGRIYIMAMTDTINAPGFDPSASVLEAHTTVLDDGSAFFFFFPCPEE